MSSVPQIWALKLYGLKPRFWLFLRRRRFRERDSLSAFGAINGEVPFVRLNLICHDESLYAAGVFISLSRDVGRERSWLAISVSPAVWAVSATFVWLLTPRAFFDFGHDFFDQGYCFWCPDFKGGVHVRALPKDLAFSRLTNSERGQ
jgi:hypothetical protein